MVALAIVIAVLIVLTVFYAPVLIRLFSHTDQFSDYIKSFGAWGVVVFIMLQALQVVISPIPGELTQLAGGFIYGTGWGTLFSAAGILIGSVLAFGITRVFGYPLLKLIVPSGKLEQFGFFINNPKAELGLLFLFLIPGMPKDILTYIAGLTPVKPARFFVIATFARLPGILMSSFIGSHVEQRAYPEVIVASVLAIGLFITAVLLRDRIIRRIKRSRPTVLPFRNHRN